MRRRCRVGLSVERRRPRNTQGLRWDRQLRTHLLSPRKKPHLRPKLRRHRLRPLRLARRHRYGRQIPVIPSDRPKALLRRRSRVRPLPARQPFIRKARSTVRQERRPRRLLRSPHGNPGPAGMLLLREVQCRQRQGSIARPCCQERSPQLAPRPGRNGGGRPANNAGTPNGAEHHLCSNCHRLTGGHEGSIQYQGGGKGTCSSVCYQTTYKEAAG